MKAAKNSTKKSIAKVSQKENTSSFPIENLLELHRDDMKRYVGGLSEEFQGRVAAIGEQFGGLYRKLEEHDEQFSVIHQVLGGLKEDMEIVKENIEIIKTDVRKRVPSDEFTALTKRVALLEKKSHQ